MNVPPYSRTSTSLQYNKGIPLHRSSPGPSGLNHGQQERALPEDLQRLYPEISIPSDIRPIRLMSSQDEQRVNQQLYPDAHYEDLSTLLNVYESSTPAVGGTYHDENSIVGVESKTTDTQKTHRKKKETTFEDKVYRSDREFVKRYSHRKMIWFFRNVGLRHPAAIRTHLEKVKHQEFELPNLQCVYPHPGLSIAFDDKWETDETEPPSSKKRKTNGNNTNAEVNGTGRSRNNESSTNLAYYNLYCATPSLVERIRTIIGAPGRHDPDNSKRVLTFIADIVGRLLWHNNRTHAVMFAKSDHYDRECFLLYSRQAEPTPFMMRSDSFFCRRHDSEKFKSIAPQPDLTRANSNRVSNESSIYVVGCNLFELWDGYPFEYRVTHCRPMKSLCERVKQIDASVLDNIFFPINTHLNGNREQSPYSEVSSKTTFDVLSVLLRDNDLKDNIADDSTAYREFLERFITIGVLNVNCMFKTNYENTVYGFYRDATSRLPSEKRLDQIVLHHVHYRRETRSLRTNRVFYYRNNDNFLCSLSLLDDMFEDSVVADSVGKNCRKPVFFYDILQPFDLDRSLNVNHLTMRYWTEVNSMIHESAYTIRKHLTPDVLMGPLPDDPFYPTSDMSPTDLAIDRMLERAIKHSKKVKLSRLTPVKREPKKRGMAKKSSKNDGRTACELLPAGLSMEDDLEIDRNTIARSLSMVGENRLHEGYVSPSRVDFETVVTHNGEHFPVKVTVPSAQGTTVKDMTPVDYGPVPRLHVDEQLVCAYLIDPKDKIQVRMIPGKSIINETRSDYVKLEITDRIVRVFTIQSVRDEYIVKPFIYFVFRNMPISNIDRSSFEEILESVNTYNGFDGFKVFDEFQFDRHERAQCSISTPRLNEEAVEEHTYPNGAVQPVGYSMEITEHQDVQQPWQDVNEWKPHGEYILPNSYESLWDNSVMNPS